MVMFALAGLVLLMVAMLVATRLERTSARAYSDAYRAELAVESGMSQFEAQVESFLSRESVGAADFTTWGYYPLAGEACYAVALSSGRPDAEGVRWLDTNNTIWLGTVGDPDETRAARGEADEVVDLNRAGLSARGWGPMLARWETIQDNELAYRYAVWVDDESSRIDLAGAGGAMRAAGTTVAELPIPAIERPLDSRELAEQKYWLTPACARISLGPRMPESADFFLTINNSGYDVLAHAPAYAAGPVAEGAYPRPFRGTRKMNLNWRGNFGSPSTAGPRVAGLANWIEAAAPEFFARGAPGFWEGTGAAAPNTTASLGVLPGTAGDRHQQFLTIAASMIDFADPDGIPTQPRRLAALDLGNPPVGGPPVLFMQDIARPEFFGADRCARINEMQVIWNSRGAADGYQANPNMQRRSIAPGLWEYTIPVTWRIELWNMDRAPIPAQAYAVRVLFSQQIDGFTFGAVGSPAVPEETELVLELNSGNPVSLEPGEVRVFDVTRAYTRMSAEDRGTTWAAFRLGGLGTIDDEPNGHTRQAMVLLAADTGEWLSATCYQATSQAPVDGVCSVGIGNKGDLKGNKINDPRLMPLRWFCPPALSPSSNNPERDATSNKPGKIGWVNNLTGSEQFNFQDFRCWRDRPRYASIVAPEEGVSAVANRGFESAGELGLILDPGWVHPDGRGGGMVDGYAYHAGVFSPFRGGGTIAAGQPERRAVLAASSWNLVDIFGVAPDSSEEVLAPEAWHGRVNVNVPKVLAGADGKVLDNLAAVFRLPGLAARAAAAPGDFVAERISAGVRQRLTRGAALPGGRIIGGWRDAQPFTSVGHLSELAAWEDGSLYVPAEAPGDGRVSALNRSDAGREEIFRRSAGLLTTRSHAYRVFVQGEVLRGGEVVARSKREVAVRFDCRFDPQTGRLLGVVPKRTTTKVR
jgi:hypothetical protein